MMRLSRSAHLHSSQAGFTSHSRKSNAEELSAIPIGFGLSVEPATNRVDLSAQFARDFRGRHPCCAELPSSIYSVPIEADSTPIAAEACVAAFSGLSDRNL